jgi:predicted nucleotidyltransferase
MRQDRPGLRPGAPTQKEREQALRDELARIVEALKELGALKVILFGSVARDQIRASSDLDLIVVMDSHEAFADRMAHLYQSVRPNVACDMLAYTPEEFEQMPFHSLLIREALREGRVIYEARPEG